MIPKVIHYCWFGHNPLPSLAEKCIDSWKKYFPGYEIKEWNETNFDVNSIPYTREAYEARKYAFVSDYARFEILYKYGGLYFDTDVEVIKPMDDIIARGAFMGCERDGASRIAVMAVNPGLGLGASPGLGLYKELLDLYSKFQFKEADGSLNLKTVVTYTTELLSAHGLENISKLQECAGIWIYPREYFCPISVESGKLNITSQTVSIHHYAQSWQSPIRKYGRKLVLWIGGRRLKAFLKSILYQNKDFIF